MMSLLLLLTVPHAQARDVRICAQWTPSLLEADRPDEDTKDFNGDGITDNDRPDRLIENITFPAHGLVYFAESRPVGGTWSFLHTGYLEMGGTHSGCTGLIDVSSSGLTQVRLTAYSTFLSAGSTMSVYDQETNSATGSAVSSTALVGLTGPTRFDVDLGTGDARITTALVMAFALNRENGGTSNLGYDIYTDFTANGGGGHNWEDKKVKVGDESEARRIVHELGHAITATMSYDVNGDVTFDGQQRAWKKTYDWTNIDIPVGGILLDADSVCEQPDKFPSEAHLSKHFNASDEATSAAIIEGIANYYVAQTINRVNEADCFMLGNNDWDHDGNLLENQDPQDSERKSFWYSCDDLPRPGDLLLTTIDDRDYWDDVCFQTSPDPNKTFTLASEYDWLRGFWDLDTDEGLTFQDIGGIFAEADPTSWLWSWEYLDTTANQPDFPDARMLEAADSLGFLSEWTNQLDNGLDR